MEKTALISYLENEIARCKSEEIKNSDERWHLDNANARYWSGCYHALEDVLDKIKFE